MQDCIIIKGIEIFAKHGCFAFEKEREQRFTVSVRLYGDFKDAIDSDDLSNTVDYGEAAELISEFTKNNTFNLIEKLGYEIARMISVRYPFLEKIEVKVSKPDAPMSVKVSDVAFCTALESHTAYLSIGSSEGNKSAYLDFAVSELKKLGKIKKISSKYVTEPYGGVAENDFLNAAVEFKCFLNPSELLDRIHEIEAKADRKREIKWADRTLDIDVISYDDLVLDTKKITLPHPDYFNREFVLTPLYEIAPDFVCPKTKKNIKQMIEELNLKSPL